MIHRCICPIIDDLTIKMIMSSYFLCDSITKSNRSSILDSRSMVYAVIFAFFYSDQADFIDNFALRFTTLALGNPSFVSAINLRWNFSIS